MAVRIYISRDAAAQALGADETTAALQVAAICNERADVRRHGAARKRAARWLPGAVHGFDTVLILRMAGPF